MKALKLVSLVNFQASPSWGCSPEYHWLQRAFSSALSALGTARGRYCNAERFWSAYYTCNKVFLLKNLLTEISSKAVFWWVWLGLSRRSIKGGGTGSRRCSSARQRSPAPSPPRRMSSEWPAALPNLTPGIWRGVRPGGNELGRAPVSNQLEAAARPPRCGRSHRHCRGLHVQ